MENINDILNIMDKKYLLDCYNNVEQIGTSIIPKDIPGYISPEPVVLTEEGQEIIFKYTPIKYTASFESGLEGIDVPSIEFTVESNIIFDPIEDEFDIVVFDHWEPKRIEPGTIGNIDVNAVWKTKGVTLSGSELNNIFSTIHTTDPSITGVESVLEDITAINMIIDPPNLNKYAPINISINDTPIYIWYVKETKSIHMYSEVSIVCNDDMSGAFANMKMLRSIDALEFFTVMPDTKLNNLFLNCTSLADLSSVEEWDPNCKEFANAFKNTVAESLGRFPAWYVYDISIHMMLNGELGEVHEITAIPGDIIYIEEIPEGYVLNQQEIVVTENNQIIEFDYRPITYDIVYNIDEFTTFTNTKTQGTYFDQDYYPPDPSKPGYKFIMWDPKYIPQYTKTNVCMTPIFIPINENIESDNGLSNMDNASEEFDEDKLREEEEDIYDDEN